MEQAQDTNNAAYAQSRAAEGGANLTDVLEVLPPACWYINFGKYGQITMRQDEAQRAADAGATVWRYATGTIVTSNVKVSGAGHDD